MAPLLVAAQSETHDFVDYDTTWYGNTAWGIRIHRPKDLFTPGSPDTASRPLIIMMPGQGEQGNSNPNNASVYGPFYWMNSGWDGSVPLGNGTHYPIIMTVFCSSSVTPNPSQFYPLLVYLIAHYHIKQNCVYGTGLSQGAFTEGGMIQYEGQLGDHAGMKLFKALAMFQGLPTSPIYEFPPRPMNCSGAWCDTNYYVTWAKSYGGRYFYLEGSGADNFRDGWHFADAMNHAVPGTGYFSYENLGDGGHCCWNTMYDPRETNWSCVEPMGPNNAPSQLGTNSMGSYFAPSNVWQWMMRQGDTSLVGFSSGSSTITANAGPDQTFTGSFTSATLSGSATPSSGSAITSYNWEEISGQQVTITDPSSATTTVTGLAVGSYKFQFQARDDKGNTAADTMTIHVNSAGPHRPQVYYWDVAKGEVVINRLNYPTLQAGDSIKIPPIPGGYRSRVLANLNAGAVPNPGDPSTYITIYWMPGAYIAPANSTIQANSVDSLYGVHEVGLKMNHHPDPLNFRYSMTGYLQYYWMDRDTCIHCGGLWNGPPYLKLHPYEGHADTAHMFWHDSISNSYFDSIGSREVSGMNTMWIGTRNTDKNQIWGRFGVSNTYFGFNPSTTVPACFIHMEACFGFTITNCVFQALGSFGPEFVGHAACIYMLDCSGEIKNCRFESNFGNAVRCRGWGGLADFPELNQLSSIHNCIDSFPLKYPFCETAIGVAGDNVYIPGFIPRASPVVYNITFAHPANGVGHQYYNSSTVDVYSGPSGGDSIRVYNCLQYGPTDTIATLCNSQGCNAFITFPNGMVKYLDTAGNRWSQTLTFAGSGLEDSIHFVPKLNGPLYNQGIYNIYTAPGVDLNGVAYPVEGRSGFGLNTGRDIGANVRPASGVPPPSSQRVVTRLWITVNGVQIEVPLSGSTFEFSDGTIQTGPASGRSGGRGNYH